MISDPNVFDDLPSRKILIKEVAKHCDAYLRCVDAHARSERG